VNIQHNFHLSFEALFIRFVACFFGNSFAIWLFGWFLADSHNYSFRQLNNSVFI